ncbi:hypothetical protein C0Q64_11105 [Streptomyces albidoflavus]|uniref:hypothetical protein n=1 Tax=Streptomyces albidoflavus TaxID=1886 RepID=UPI00101E239D|nr:hypothetical protein [Streptomyces albidoflavus]RZE02819.1 hypothetical protein C0Q64_11105 [Streptomyces albidoflavus]RZE03660.1 hypothetical protein C0Q65_11435 [Streptomyces albidoflavus]
MDDRGEFSSEPADAAAAGLSSGDEEAASVPLSVEATDEQVDHIRQLRERGLPQTAANGGVDAEVVGFGSGDAAGTIYKNYYGAPAVDPVDGRVPDDDLNELRELYVAPASYEPLVEHLKRHGVAVLRGAPGSGRYTTALLAVRTAMRTGVVVLDSEAGVRRLVTEEGGLRPSRGHVVEGDGTQWANELRPQLLIRLREATYKRSPLVIVVDDQVPRGSLSGHVVEHEMAEGMPFRVLERHLEVLLDDRPVDRRKLLEHEVLRADLRGRRSMAEVAGLARQLVRRVRDGDDVDQIVQGLSAGLRDTAVKLLGPPRKEAAGEPVKELSLWARAFLLASVVLHGKTLSRVSRESHRLAELLHGVRSPSSAPAMPLFEESVRDWLGHSDVEFTDRSGHPVESRHPECLVRVSRRGMGEAVLEVLWHDHSGARGPFLEWLDGLVVRSEEDIVVAAAQTVGLLATFDWAYVHEELLVRWASGRGEHADRRRFAAAWALERAVTDPLLAPRVQRLLSLWAQRRDFQACAQAAYGTRIGAQFPAEALNSLERIAGAGTRSVWASVREIYAAGSRAQVLERLARWSASTRHWLRDDAAKCFQGLSRFRGDRAVTAFLKEPRSREHLLILGRRTLLSGSRAHRQCGWNAMRLWVERAGDEPGLDELVAAFFAELPESGAESDRLRERLAFHLRLWSHQLPDGETAVLIKSFVEEKWSM